MALQDLTPQLRTRLGRVERLVGLFLILTVALMLSGLAYFVRFTAKEQGWFVKKFPYYTYVSEVTGIKIGTPVTMMGFKVGEVTAIDQAPPEPYFVNESLFVYIGFKVRSPYEGYIYTDSRVKVGGGDFLVTRTLEITRGNAGDVT
ncbi:MAG: MCE family protein, partial [Verrucomicrobiae bacterium]|nr:MCE family protein [Verrucomicrobiae bacterium]